MKVTLRQKILSCTLVLVLMDSAMVSPSAVAEFDLGARIRALFTRQNRVGVSRDRRSGAAVRDPDLCPIVETPLTALVPDIDEPIKTSLEHPAFWFYSPYAQQPANSADSTSNNHGTYTLKFVLQDEQNHDVYQTQFLMPETAQPGVFSLRFLSAKAALEVGKRYRWYFLIYCNDRKEIYEPAFVEGLIQREALTADLQSKIDQEKPQDRFLAYAEARLWYDTLAGLDASRSESEASTQSQWAAILQGVGLGKKISQQPIIGRYYVPPDN